MVLLSDLRANGLLGDVSLLYDTFIEKGEKTFLEYVLRYTVTTAREGRVFIPGASVEGIMKDIAFNDELVSLILPSIAFFKKGIEAKFGPTIHEWAERKAWSGIISEHGVNYMDQKALSRASLESMWIDYDMVFPEEVTVALASEYGLDAFHFSQWFGGIAYLESMCRDGRKIVDHVYIDALDCPSSLLPRLPLWNSQKAMVGNMILSLDWLNGRDEEHWDMILLPDVIDLLKNHGMPPYRLGFPSSEECA